MNMTLHVWGAFRWTAKRWRNYNVKVVVRLHVSLTSSEASKLMLAHRLTQSMLARLIHSKLFSGENWLPARQS